MSDGGTATQFRTTRCEANAANEGGHPMKASTKLHKQHADDLYDALEAMVRAFETNNRMTKQQVDAYNDALATLAVASGEV